MTISWPSVTTPNGEIVNYTLIESSSARIVWFSGLGNSTRVMNLRPYTQYFISIVVCNHVACIESAHTTFTTLQAGEETSAFSGELSL